MRDYDDRSGRYAYGRGRDEMGDYGRYDDRRDHDYRSGSGTGGYRQDTGYGRGSQGSDYDYGEGRGRQRARDRGADYAHGMMEDMRRYARGDYDRDEDRGYGHERDRDYARGRSREYRGDDWGRGSEWGQGSMSGGMGSRSDWNRSDWGRDDRSRSGWSTSDWSSGGRSSGGRSSGDWGRSDSDRGYRDRDWGGSSTRGTGRSGERGFMERAGDEIASWFGDEDAERRRRQDEARSHRGRGPRGYARSDDRIREDVNDRLTDDPHVDGSDIDITVSSGEVTLNGHVPHRSMKRRAEDIAESVSGVRHVQNNLRVQQSTGMGTGSSTTAGASAMAGMGGTATGTDRTTGTSRTDLSTTAGTVADRPGT